MPIDVVSPRTQVVAEPPTSAEISEEKQPLAKRVVEGCCSRSKYPRSQPIKLTSQICWVGLFDADGLAGEHLAEVNRSGRDKRRYRCAGRPLKRIAPAFWRRAPVPDDHQNWP